MIINNKNGLMLEGTFTIDDDTHIFVFPSNYKYIGIHVTVSEQVDFACTLQGLNRSFNPLVGDMLQFANMGAIALSADGAAYNVSWHKETYTKNGNVISLLMNHSAGSAVCKVHVIGSNEL